MSRPWITGDFRGTFTLANVVESQTVEVFISDRGDISLGAKTQLLTRRHLTFVPFCASMLFTQDPQRMAAPYFFELRATHLGVLSNSVGHPGDGESECWPLTSIRLDVRYEIDRICVQFEGRTELGSSPYHDRPLDSLPFLVSFGIPKIQAADFFQLRDSTRTYFYSLYDKHCIKGGGGSA